MLEPLENRVPPVVWFLTAASAQQVLPAGRRRSSLHLVSALLGAGAAVTGLRALVDFHHHRTSANPLEPARASTLVTDGAYRTSRNPMYLAMALALAANAARRSSSTGLVPLLGYLAVMTRLQIIPEERVLQEHFGQDWAAWAARTRRWI